MKRWSITLNLLDDLVLSRRSATLGDHQALDRIPGATLRGACAARLYSALGDKAWTVFHSGQVRWLDGLPADSHGQRSAPVPLSWHRDKGNVQAETMTGGYWNGSALFNLAADSRAMGEECQPKGLREGYVGPGGEALLPRRRFRLMTAIADDGQVADGQLFGYESLAAGQRFVAALEVDDGVEDAVVQQLCAVLQGRLSLGRSRSAQYGRVQANIAPWAAPAPPPLPQPGQPLHLLLMSDLCLRDRQGRPTLTPDAASLGLPEGVRVDSQRSSVRTRRYSPWNAYRNGPEMERQLLGAGGVITLVSDSGWSGPLIQHLTAGLGCDRAQGLGEVWVQPPLLAEVNPRFTAAARAPAAAPIARPDSPLLKWLTRDGATQPQSRSDLAAWSSTTLTALKQRWQTLRSYQAIPASAEWGPGASQWGALAAEAARASTVKDLQSALLGDDGIVSRKLKNAQAKEDKKFWDDEATRIDNKPISLAQWVNDSLDALAACGSGSGAEAARLDAWQQLCSQVRQAQAHRNTDALAKLSDLARQGHRPPAQPTAQESR